MSDSGADKCAFVTGTAGFIGSHLSRWLVQRGRRVVGVDNFDPFYDPRIKRSNLSRIEYAAAGRFTFEQADIRDRSAITELVRRIRPTAVFHMAALAGVRPSIENPAAYAAVNIDGLINVLDAVRAADCRTVVFASSSSVYGNASRVPFSEEDPAIEPISPYAATKRAGELICSTYAHLFGLQIAALRFFTVYGPAQRPDLAIAKFMRLIAAGHEIPMFGDGSMSRDYTYIDDVIAGVLAAEHAINAVQYSTSMSPEHAAESAASSLKLQASIPAGAFRIWNLGSSHPMRLDEMIEMIAKVIGRKPRIKRLPPQPGDVERTFADLTRSRAELGYAPQMDFEQGLREQWRWMESQQRMAIR